MNHLQLIKKPIPFFCILLIVSSCKYTRNKEEKLAQILELEIRVNGIDSLLQITQPDSLSIYYADAMKKGPVIDRVQHLTEKENSAFIEYMTHMRFLPRLKKVHFNIQEATNQCKKQLNNLSSDVNNGLISNRKFKKYIEIETAAVDKLENMELKPFRGAVNGVNGYKQNKVIIDSLYECITSKTYKPKK